MRFGFFPTGAFISTNSALLILTLPLENTQIQQNPLTHPDRPLRVISLLLLILLPICGYANGVGMHQHAERPAVYGQPGDEGAELRGGEEVRLEHGDGVGPDGAVPEAVGA